MNQFLSDDVQVVGESRSKEEYFSFPDNFCACYSFFYDVVNRGEQLCVSKIVCVRVLSYQACSYQYYFFSLNYRFLCRDSQCKHQLAARLAASLGSFIEVEVSDEELALLLSKLQKWVFMKTPDFLIRYSCSSQLYTLVQRSIKF